MSLEGKERKGKERKGRRRNARRGRGIAVELSAANCAADRRALLFLPLSGVPFASAAGI